MNTEKLLGLFKKLYIKVKYSTQDQLDMPFIFAFSAHLDTHVVLNADKLALTAALMTN